MLGPDARKIRLLRQDLENVLDLAQGLVAAMDFLHVLERRSAAYMLANMVRKHGDGLSDIHDSLLAQAYALQYKNFLATGDRHAAVKAINLARMHAPDSAELLEHWARLMRLTAKPDLIPDRLREAANLHSPSSAAARLSERELSRSKASSRRFEDLGTTRARARLALDEKDFQSARAWASRARDMAPRDLSANLLMAEALEGSGEIRACRDLRIHSLHLYAPGRELLLSLAANEMALGEPGMGLRWLLRHKKLFPNLMENSLAKKLMHEIGFEESLRAFMSEGRLKESLPQILDWLATEPGTRSTFLSSFLLSLAVKKACEESLALPTLELVPDSMHGSSGIRHDPPTQPAR